MSCYFQFYGTVKKKNHESEAPACQIAFRCEQSLMGESDLVIMCLVQSFVQSRTLKLCTLNATVYHCAVAATDKSFFICCSKTYINPNENAACDLNQGQVLHRWSRVGGQRDVEGH